MSGLISFLRATGSQSRFLHVASVFSRNYTPFNPPERKGEDIGTKRNRLLYESRKRGNLENGIILATFADLYLSKLNMKQLDAYDNLINKPDSDWDIYYWAIGQKEPPEEFNTDVLAMLKQHAMNHARELRNQQPPVRSYKE